MDQDLLRSKGLAPQRGEIGSVRGHVLRIGRRAGWHGGIATAHFVWQSTGDQRPQRGSRDRRREILLHPALLSPKLVVHPEMVESRRPLFNFCVGTAGLLSIGMTALIGRLPPHPGSFPVPWSVVLVYAVLANLCYTLGPVTDLVLRRMLGDRAPAIAPVLFRYGFVFSLGLTLLPIPLAVLGWLVRWFW